MPESKYGRWELAPATCLSDILTKIAGNYRNPGVQDKPFSSSKNVEFF